VLIVCNITVEKRKRKSKEKKKTKRKEKIKKNVTLRRAVPLSSPAIKKAKNNIKKESQK